MTASDDTAATSTRDRLVTALAATAVVALLVVGVVVVLGGGDDGGRPPSADGNLLEQDRSVAFSDLPAYRDVDDADADALKAEQDRFAGSLVPDPDTGARSPDFVGEFTNVADGVRRSATAPSCDCRTVTVWWLGGSAAFGLGQRDDHTIPSDLVRLAEEAGVSLVVENLAVPGWTRANEVTAIEQLLSDGRTPPDLVVLYDGFNDVVGGIIDATVNGFDPDRVSELRGDDVVELGRSGRRLDAVAPDRMADALVDRMTTQRDRLADVLGSGTSVVEVFQPDALAAGEQLDGIRDTYPYLDDETVDHLGDVMGDVARRGDPPQTDLRGVYDGLDHPVFSNLVHTNEEGAQIVADAIWPLLATAIG